MLGCEGYQGTGAPDGAVALELLLQVKKPTLVFFDLMMLKMNGRELLDHENIFENHKVVTMSVFESTANLQNFILPDVDDRLLKPVSLDQFLNSAKRSCGVFMERQAVAQAR